MIIEMLFSSHFRNLNMKQITTQLKLEVDLKSIDNVLKQNQAQFFLHSIIG